MDPVSILKEVCSAANRLTKSEPVLALNKLEKVALRCVRKRNKPLVLVINNVHHFKNDEEGRNMLLQLQQNAEAWAASGM